MTWQRCDARALSFEPFLSRMQRSEVVLIGSQLSLRRLAAWCDKETSRPRAGDGEHQKQPPEESLFTFFIAAFKSIGTFGEKKTPKQTNNCLFSK